MNFTIRMLGKYQLERKAIQTQGFFGYFHSGKIRTQFFSPKILPELSIFRVLFIAPCELWYKNDIFRLIQAIEGFLLIKSIFDGHWSY